MEHSFNVFNWQLLLYKKFHNNFYKKDCKIHSPPLALDLDLTVLSLDWGINKKDVVGMLNLDYMVSSKVAGLPLIHKTGHVSFPTSESPSYYV